MLHNNVERRVQLTSSILIDVHAILLYLWNQGGAPRTRALPSPISFIFVKFLGKIGHNNRLAPTCGIGVPPGNPGNANVHQYLSMFLLSCLFVV